MTQKTHYIELVDHADNQQYYWTGSEFSTDKGKAWSSPESYDAVIERPEANKFASAHFKTYKIFTFEAESGTSLNPHEVK